VIKCGLYCRENDREIKVKDGKSAPQIEMTPEREEILNQAFRQYRKSRKKIDKNILQKIKEFVENNQHVQKILGFKSKPKSRGMVKIDQKHNQDVVEKFLAIKPDHRNEVKKFTE